MSTATTVPNSTNSLMRKALPHVVALLLFAAISALFFAPQYDGEALRQYDMIQASGMDNDIQQHKATYGEHPQWAGNAFSGMPAYLVNMNYDGRWVKTLADHSYILGQPASWIFIAMAGFYLMLLMFGVNPWLGIIGGVAYGLSSYFVIIIGAGHITKMMALAWIAPLVGSIWYAYHNHRWLGASLAGIFAAIEISTSHPQITYYFLFVIIALVINELISAYKDKTLGRFGKTTATLALAAALAIGANIVQLYYVADHSSETIRGRSELTSQSVDTDGHTSGLDKEYATAWSYGKMETFNLLIPNLQGGGHDFASDGPVAESLRQYQAPRDYSTMLPSYWGSQPSTEGPVYIGAAIIFLAFLGFFLLGGRQKWWIVVVSALAIALAWGSNMMWLSDIFLDYVPLYNKFRTVSMILVIVEWSLPLVAILALQKLWSDTVSAAQFKKAMLWSLGLVGGFCMAVLLFGSAFADFSGASDSMMGLPEDVINAMQHERAALLRSDSMRSLGFVLVMAAMVWALYAGKIKRWLFVTAAVAVVAADLATVDLRYVNHDDFRPKREATAITMTAADKAILEDTTNYRVANLTVNPWSDATTSYYHRSVGGYHAAKLRRYQDIIDRHLARNNTAVFNMLNTKYFIIPSKDGEPTVQVNPQAAGNAWFVHNIEWVDSPDQEIAALDATSDTTGFDPRRTAVIDRRFMPMLENMAMPVGDDPVADSAMSIRLVSYRVNRLTYKSTSPYPGVAVFSEIYFPKGWTAYIDGVEAPYFRADYILRAMLIPAGEHTIEFRFAAPHHAMLVAVTRTSSLILILGTVALIAGLALRRRL